MSVPFPVLKIQGPPGSGKSRDLAREAIRLLLQDGVPAGGIRLLAMTSRNRARLKAYLQQEAELAGIAPPPIAVETWENFCHKLLSRYASSVTVSGPADFDRKTLAPDFQILAEPQARLILQHLLLQRLDPEHPWYFAAHHPSLARQIQQFFHLLALQPQQAEAFLSISNQSEPGLALLQALYRDFRACTLGQSLLAYPDLLQLSVQLLRENPACLAELRHQYQVLCLDEAQELSALHYDLLEGLSPGVRLVMAGSEALSIRHYRGAEPALFKGLGERFLITNEVRPSCLRNNEGILALLGQWNRLSKGVWEAPTPETSEPNQVKLHAFVDSAEEARSLADWIAGILRQSLPVVDPVDRQTRPVRPSDFVILLRSAAFKPVLLDALMQKGVPVRAGGLYDNLLPVHNYLYDALAFFSALETLEFNGDLDTLPGLLQAAERRSVSVITRKTAVETANRHLQRLLHYGNGQGNGFSLVDTEDRLLMQELLTDPETEPDCVNRVQGLLSIYRAYRAHQEVSQLVAGLMALGQAQFSPFRQDESSLDDAESLLLKAFSEALATLQAHYHKATRQLVPLAALLALFDTLWDEDALPESSPEEAVQILSIHQAQGEEWPFVLVPFLTASEFPQLHRQADLLSAQVVESLGCAPPNLDETEAQEARLLATALTRATTQAILTTHQKQEGKSVLPSAFYEELFRLCQAAPSQAVDEIPPLPSQTAVSGLSSPHAGRYIGQSSWARLATQQAKPLYGRDETLTLSASALKTYMDCPRKFYYRQVLRLPDAGSDAATVGSLIHKVLEVFNRQFGQRPCTADSLKSLVTALFDEAAEPDSLLQEGFKATDLSDIAKLSPVRRQNLAHQLLASVDELARKGYFQYLASARSVQAEYKLNAEIEGLDGCRISGTVDVLVQQADGQWDILDYKTTQSGWSAKPATCEKNLANILAPLPEGDDVSHGERFQATASRPRDYQLPLYYLAMQQERPIRSVGLQLVRPAFPNDPEQGAIRLSLDQAALESSRQQVLDDLNTYLVGPIRNSQGFAMNPSRQCVSCTYFPVCESTGDRTEDEPGGAIHG